MHSLEEAGGGGRYPLATSRIDWPRFIHCARMEVLGGSSNLNVPQPHQTPHLGYGIEVGEPDVSFIVAGIPTFPLPLR
jgi:hypothetical protein